MKKEFEDFLFNFTTDYIGFRDDPEKLKVQATHRVLINDLLKEVSAKDVKKYASQLNNRWLALGFKFLDECIEFVDGQNKVKFLEFVWLMFAFERDQTDWHQWSGQFDPLYEAKPDWKYAKWFREGAIRFELKGYKEQYILGPLEYTFQYLWWKNIEHFLGELCEFQTNDFILIFLKQLGKKLDKDEQLSISNKMNNFQILEVFKTWADDDLKRFDEEEMDWSVK